jgi:hypothetical protein
VLALFYTQDLQMQRYLLWGLVVLARTVFLPSVGRNNEGMRLQDWHIHIHSRRDGLRVLPSSGLKVYAHLFLRLDFVRLTDAGLSCLNGYDKTQTFFLLL